MIRKIQIPSDGPDFSERAVESAMELAKATGASVVGCVVTEPYPLRMYGDLMFRGIETVRDYNSEERLLSQRSLAKVERAAAIAGVRYAGYSVSSHSPADAIIAAAEDEGCDLIGIAVHDHHNLFGGRLDEETTKVLTHTKVPVLVCRRSYVT